MLLSVLWSPEAPEAAHHAARDVSLYLKRAPSAAGTFLWGVAIIAVLAFVGAIVSSMRVSEEPPPK